MPKGVKGFQKGRAKTGGKSLGCKHKITRDVAGLLDELGCNPIEGMARIALDPKASEPIKARMLAELAKYTVPQLRSVEVTGRDGNAIEVSYVSVTEQLRSGIARLASRKPPEPTP
jgi:hypothetical protein